MAMETTVTYDYIMCLGVNTYFTVATGSWILLPENPVSSDVKNPVRTASPT